MYFHLNGSPREDPERDILKKSASSSELKLMLNNAPFPPQLFGHSRSPSMEFKELTKRDAQISLAQELDKLRRTGNLPDQQAKAVDKEFDGFKELFGKFLTSDSSAEAIKWGEIEKLPQDAVRFCLTKMTASNAGSRRFASMTR